MYSIMYYQISAETDTRIYSDLQDTTVFEAKIVYNMQLSIK